MNMQNNLGETLWITGMGAWPWGSDTAPPWLTVSAVTWFTSTSYSFVHLATIVSRVGPFVVLHQQW